MYISSSSIRLLSLATLLVPPTALAQTIDKLSFGHKQPIGKDGHIPNWKLSGENNDPQVFSDRVILTPPYPGNTRGAIWSDEKPSSNIWEVEFEFRASGPERGTGNLQLWYTREEQSKSIGSVYTVGTFDGLALVLDQYGGAGGSIRGFLNDGSKNYKSLHSLDPEAFGHCHYSYRNLGVPSKLNVRHGNDGLTVLIDGRTCFQSDKVALPAGYYFGVSAAAAEHPDSFEVTKFVVSSSTGTGSSQYSPQGQGQPQQQQMQPPPAQQQQQYPPPPPPAATSPANQQPDARITELLTLVQTLQNNIRNLQSTIDDLAHRHSETSNKLSGIENVDRRVQSVESTVKRIQNDLEGKDYRDTLQQLQNSIRETQANIMTSLPQTLGSIVTGSAPQMGFFLFVVLGFQAAMAGLYVFYKRRRANSPKKLL